MFMPKFKNSDTEPCEKAGIPLVSIIVNTLNGEATLAEALDSVLAQSFDDWELILFDDMSTDGTLEIFNSYSDLRFRSAVAEQRLDLARAREAALELARGEWLAFLDQDDMWTPDKLERQLKQLESEGSDKVGLIYCRAKRFGWIDKDQDFEHHFDGLPLPEGQIFNTLATVANFITQSSAMIRRRAYEEIDSVPENVSFCPDFYFWMAISRRWDVRVVQETCCLYRVRGNDFTSHRAVQIFTEFLHIIELFGTELDPAALNRRRRECQNLIGIAEIASGNRSDGIARIFRHGSFLHIANRALPYFGRTTRQWLNAKKRWSS